MKNLKSILKTSCQFIIFITIFYFIFRIIEPQKFIILIKKANFQLLLIVFILESFCVFLQASRWFFLLQSFPEKNFWEIQYINYSAMFFDLFVPGKLGSDSFRVITLKKKEKISNIIGSLLTHRIQGFVFSLLIFLIFVNIYSDLIHIPTWLTAIILILILIIFFSIIKIKNITFHKYSNLNIAIEKILNNLIIIKNYVNQLIHSQKRITLSIMMIILFILLSSISFAIAGKAFNSDLQLSYYFIGTPAIMITGMIPITIHGRGITEATALYFWSNSTNSTEQVLLTCFTVYGCSLILSILASILLILKKYRKNRTLIERI